MSSTFQGLNSASSGLQAQQTALNVVGNNVANANTPGYTRRRAALQASPDTANGRTSTGNGVEVSTVQRLQDSFTTDRLRTATSDLAYSQTGKDALDAVVSIFGEPSDSGLSSNLDKFWNSWQSLSVNPDSPAARQSVLQSGQAVAAQLNSFSEQIGGLKDQQDATLQNGVKSINDLAGQLAGVNEQIESAQNSGIAPNDLLDQRDAILGSLSQLTDMKVTGDGGAGDMITVGGHVLVQGNHASPLTATKDETGQISLRWAEDNSEANVKGGEVGAALILSKDVLPGYLSDLDELAQGVMNKVNDLHRSGTGLDKTTGTDFFQGSGARDLKVNPALTKFPRKIAASASGTSGDGSLALSIAKVKTDASQDGMTLNGAYQTLVTHSAYEASRLSNQVDQKLQVQDQLTIQQQSVSGVNLDEEMTNMIRFQQAYAANARVVSAMDGMLGTLIDQLGR